MLVRLSVYKEESPTADRFIAVHIGDEELVPKTLVTSSDVDDPQNIEFEINRDPGFYDIVITPPDHSVEDDGAVTIKSISVKESVDDTRWRDIKVNALEVPHVQPYEQFIKTDAANSKNASSLATMWFGNEVTVNLHILTNPEFSDKYKYTNIDHMITGIENFLAAPKPDTTEEWLQYQNTLLEHVKSMRQSFN